MVLKCRRRLDGKRHAEAVPGRPVFFCAFLDVRCRIADKLALLTVAARRDERSQLHTWTGAASGNNPMKLSMKEKQ